MKVFIVFLSLLILNINFLIYQNDYSDFMGMQESVKHVAEDCAFGSSMYFDAEAYGKGYLKYNEEECIRYIDYVLSNAEEKYGYMLTEDINCNVYFFDDSGIYREYENGNPVICSEFQYPFDFTDCSGFSWDIEEPSVVVVLNVKTEDMFRQPFIESGVIVRSSAYSNSES